MLTHFEIFIVVCSIEDEDHVHEENEVDGAIDDFPIEIILLEERESEGCDSACEYQNQRYKQVPLLFPFVLGIDHASTSSNSIHFSPLLCFFCFR
jgi:hypothetical protein